MKMFRKIISLLLVFIALSPKFICYASDEVMPIWEYELTITIVSTGDPISNSFSDDENMTLGHSFLIINNGSTIPITIGHMQVPAESSITIGTFGNRSTHIGIWYNIEGYNQDSYNGSAASYSIPYSDITVLNSTINSNDEYDGWTDNCTTFACDVWNAVVPDAYHVSGYYPADLENSINDLSFSTTSYTIPQKNINEIAYQTTTSIGYSTLGANRH